MQRTGAFKGGLERSSKRGLNTLNVDLLDWVTLDNNGDRYTLTGAVLGTTFPAVRQQPAKSGVVTAKSVREVKHEIEVLTDPGGTNGYAIQRVHKDQGSEFKSEHLDDCMAGNVKSTTGEEEKHTDGTLVEGFNKVLEYTCTALGLTAIDDSEVAIRCHGELANHACDLIRMRSRTAFQKEAGISCWREQTLTDHDATLKDSCRWGSLAFGYVKKENRQNKLDERAYQAIFGGWDKEILGAARLIPFEIQDDGEVVLFMTKVTKTFRLFDGTFPLLRNGGECVYPAETREWVDGDELQLFVPETAAAGSEWVVEQLLAKNVYCTDTGAAEYKCRFAGFGPDDDLWIDADDLQCPHLVAEWEKSEKKHSISAAVEANICDSWTKYESDLLGRMQVDNGASDYVPSSIEEGDFEAKIAFSFLHECSPRLVSQKVIDLSSAGSRGYRSLFKTLMAENNEDWTWVLATIQQDGPLPAEISNKIVSAGKSPLVNVAEMSAGMVSWGNSKADSMASRFRAAFSVVEQPAAVKGNSNPSRLPSIGEGAKRGEVTNKEATRPEFIGKATVALDRELKHMGEKRFINDGVEPTAEEKKGALEGRIVWTVKDADKLEWSMKARLVAKDLKCRRWCDPVDSYASVPSLKTFRLLMAASGGKRISTADLICAYLQANKFRTGEFFWLKFWNPIKGCWVFQKLSGYIYGCQEGGQSWAATFREWMVEGLGFTEICNAGSVYVKDFDSEDSDLIGADGEGSGVPTAATKEASLTGMITVSCYVDDPVIVCDTEAAEQWYHNEMEKRFDVKHHSYLTVATPLEYCGTRLSLTVDNELKVDNKRFIEKMLDERGLQDANSVQSPLTKTTLSHLFANKDKLLDAAESTCFRSGLGQVHWLAATTHAKLAPAHSMLAKYTANPCEGCLEALKTCIRYAAGVKEECLVMPADITEGLKVYTDSDWAGSYSVDQDTHSRTGVLVTYNGVPVDWMSAKQLCIATSSGDAESRALASGVQRGLQIQYIAEELLIATPSVLHIWVDAEAAIGFARNNGGGTKMKHLDIRMQWVQEIRDKKKIKIHKVAGPHNRSDFFTKLMTKSEFKRTSEGLCGKL